MFFYPNSYLKNIREVDFALLQQNHIKGLILDVDNTLIDYYRHLPKETVEWCNELKRRGIKMCILSNSNKKEKVKQVAQALKLPYYNFAMKPLKRGFKKARQQLGLPNEQIGVIGDQIFTDVIGANRCHMFSILVDPIMEKDIFVTILKRPLENWIKKNYQKKKTKGK